ncbi:MAG: hypothetical protein ACRD1K_13395 [Acidimicrobiales bacterium]
MSWRVVLGDAALAGLSEAEQDAVSSDLFPWVEDGPPRINSRTVLGAMFFEDEIPSGYRIAYFVDESVPYVAILRVRKA